MYYGLTHGKDLVILCPEISGTTHFVMFVIQMSLKSKTVPFLAYDKAIQGGILVVNQCRNLQLN